LKENRSNERREDSGERATDSLFCFFIPLRIGNERESGSGGERRRRRVDCQFDAKRGKKGGGAANGASKKRGGIKKNAKNFFFFLFLDVISRKRRVLSGRERLLAPKLQ